jgi:hypothetical protein
MLKASLLPVRKYFMTLAFRAEHCFEVVEIRQRSGGVQPRDRLLPPLALARCDGLGYYGRK